jgi:transcriptional regulator with XRE-family HTH domain
MDEEKDKGGRPTKYEESFIEEAYELCLLGCTMEELGEYFEVNKSTISEWKKNYPEFSAAVNDGKLKADRKVARSLYDRAIGCTITKQQIVKLRVGEDEVMEVVDLTIELPPDIGACKFWLNNRQPLKWKDKREEKEDDNKFKGTFILQVGKDGIVPLPSREEGIVDFTMNE